MNDNKIIFPEIVLHSTPLAKIKIDDICVQIEFDDVCLQRYRATFLPFQGVRVTTSDCVNAERAFCRECKYDNVYHRHILEIKESQWLNELQSNLYKRDKDATFLNEAKHFLFDVRDSIVEVVASRISIEKITVS